MRVKLLPSLIKSSIVFIDMRCEIADDWDSRPYQIYCNRHLTANSVNSQILWLLKLSVISVIYFGRCYNEFLLRL